MFFLTENPAFRKERIFFLKSPFFFPEIWRLSFKEQDFLLKKYSFRLKEKCLFLKDASWILVEEGFFLAECSRVQLESHGDQPPYVGVDCFQASKARLSHVEETATSMRFADLDW